jgi:hypothetical protein
MAALRKSKEIEIIYPEICFDGNESESKFSSSCERLVGWAKEVTELSFLADDIPPRCAAARPRCEAKPCPSVLERSSGVREHIGNFVGLKVTKTKQLRILRNVVEVFPSLIKH